MFRICKYTDCYFAIIQNRLRNPFSGYTERHHILPGSLGGLDDSSNIVSLTAREHYVCHKLLARMTEDNPQAHQKMSFALHKMTYGTNSKKYCVRSSDYESVRKLNAEAVRWMQLERFEDKTTYLRQIELAAAASKVAAERNRGNENFRAKKSKQMRKRVEDGVHNFLGGQIQRDMWQDPAYQEKQRLVRERQFREGTHISQNAKFREQSKVKLKQHWASMTDEERKLRGQNISIATKGRTPHNKAKHGPAIQFAIDNSPTIQMLLALGEKQVIIAMGFEISPSNLGKIIKDLRK